jgi:L-ascorbate metabolism protein UlaG (beta-lactamase superfamily)
VRSGPLGASPDKRDPAGHRPRRAQRSQQAKESQSLLITYGHADHIAPGIAENADLQIWGPEDVITQLTASGVSSAQVHAVGPGDIFETAAFQIAVLGGRHATIHPDLPPVSNNAYLIDDQILHPGDSFTDASDQAKIIHLFVPVTAPWMRLADAVDSVRSHGNATAVPIHDGILNEAGKQLTDTVMTALLGRDRYRRVNPGESLSISAD